MNENKSTQKPKQVKLKDKSKKFHTYSNDKLGISFKYQDNWIKVKNGINENKLNVNMYAHEQGKEFRVSRLPTKMTPFIRRWRSIIAIYCVLNNDESIVEDIQVNKYIIDNEETVSLIACSSSKKTNSEYILVPHKEQYYLFMIRSSCDSKKIVIDDTNDQIKKILESFKFLD